MMNGSGEIEGCLSTEGAAGSLSSFSFGFGFDSVVFFGPFVLPLFLAFADFLSTFPVFLALSGFVMELFFWAFCV